MFLLSKYQYKKDKMYLYYMDVSNLNLEDIKKYVSKDRWETSKKYFHLKDKQLHMGSEALLNYILKKINIENPLYDITKYGKPFLKNYPGINFNISHSEKYVFCGVSNQAIGVDIEYHQNIDLNIAKTNFHKEEYDYIINSENKIKSFYDIWTLKESYLKMEGLGLNLDLNSFIINIIKNNIQITFNEEIPNSLDKKINFKLWNIKDNQNKNYSLGVCALKKIDEIKLINFKEIIEKN